MSRREKHVASIATTWTFVDFSLEVENVTIDLVPIDSNANNPELPQITRDGALKLPDLEAFSYGPLEDLSQEPASIASEDVNERDAGDEHFDIWAAVPFERYDASYRTRSWEQFQEKDFKEPLLYLSEATQDVWHAVWQKFDETDGLKKSNYIPAVRSDYVLKALVDLGMGLNSALFYFDKDGKAQPREDSMLYGLSPMLSLAVIQDIGVCGASFRHLERLEKLHLVQSGEFRCMISAMSVISRIARIAKQWIAETSTKAATILQLKDTLQRPSALLTKLQGLLEILERQHNDVSLINSIATFIEEIAEKESWFKDIATHLLHATSKPHLEDVSHAVGLSRKHLTVNAKHNPVVGLLTAKNSLADNARSLPNIFNDQQKSQVASIKQSLDLLAVHQPHHQLLSLINSSNSLTELRMAKTWADLERFKMLAEEYARSFDRTVRNEVQSSLTGHFGSTVAADPTSINPYNLELESLEDQFYVSLKIFDRIEDDGESSDELRLIVHEALKPETRLGGTQEIRPPLLVLISESFTPLLSAQAGLVSKACMSMVFRDHHLVHNLRTLYDFHLLGSGIFSTKLSQALFSPDLSSAERKKGYHRYGQLGLRLGSRLTWPPASAELRLALMGILSDCYDDTVLTTSKTDTRLPGDLSFAVRNLAEPEIEACMDWRSLAALDFLRLQYRPPGALGAVITESSLTKYDQIFRFLLRLNRVSFAIDQLWLDRRSPNRITTVEYSRFVFESRQFVQAVVAYVHTTIVTIWNRFNRCLEIVQAQVERESSFSVSASLCSLSQLSSLHELMLDNIMFDLLLRRRHEKVLQVLEEALSQALQVAMAADQQVKLMSIKEFTTKVNLFVTVCRNLSQRSDYALEETIQLPVELRKVWSQNTNPSGGLRSLVLALDMNGWYSKQDSRV